MIIITRKAKTKVIQSAYPKITFGSSYLQPIIPIYNEVS